MNDDKLRALYGARVAASVPADRSCCPSPEQLQRLAESGNGGNSANLAMLDHVFGCAYCRPEFALLRTVQAESEAVGGATTARTKAANRWLTGPRLAIAAGLLIALGIGGESLRRMRAGESSDVVRNAAVDANEIALVAPLSNTAGAKFVWHKMAGAITYEVQVLDTNGSVLATRVTSDTVYSPSASEREQFELAGMVDWFVVAKRSDGNERRSSIARVRAGPTDRRQ